MLHNTADQLGIWPSPQYRFSTNQNYHLVRVMRNTLQFVTIFYVDGYILVESSQHRPSRKLHVKSPTYWANIASTAVEDETSTVESSTCSTANLFSNVEMPQHPTVP